MGIFDDIGKKISVAAEVTASKAKEQVDIVKLSSSISAEQKKLESYYSEIGKAVYESNSIPDPQFADIYEKIRESERIISLSQSKISDIKRASANYATGLQCPICSHQNLAGTNFCGGCGNKL